MKKAEPCQLVPGKLTAKLELSKIMLHEDCVDRN